MAKRAILPALMISALLAGCGGADAETRIEERRDALADAEEITFTALVTADLGDEVFKCTLLCGATPEALTVEVAAPEAVAGVRARMSAGETTLEYEGVILSVGGLEDGPLAAMPLLLAALKSGHVIRAWAEEDGGCFAAQLYADDEEELTVWFDAETLSPVAASLSREGAERIRCEIQEFQFR